MLSRVSPWAGSRRQWRQEIKEVRNTARASSLHPRAEGNTRGQGTCDQPPHYSKALASRSRATGHPGLHLPPRRPEAVLEPEGRRLLPSHTLHQGPPLQTTRASSDPLRHQGHPGLSRGPKDKMLVGGTQHKKQSPHTWQVDQGLDGVLLTCCDLR